MDVDEFSMNLYLTFEFFGVRGSGGEAMEETIGCWIFEDSGMLDCEGDDLKEASVISENMMVKRKTVTNVRGKEWIFESE